LALFVGCATPQKPFDAKHLIDEGILHLEMGDGERALASFDKAYLLEPSPQILLLRARTYLALHEEAQARCEYASYLRLVPNPDAAALKVLKRLGGRYECSSDASTAQPKPRIVAVDRKVH
jgi:Flp pilus assembly protein TadD